MISMNQVTIIGRLTDAPILRSVQSNNEPVSVCNFSIAVNGDPKKGSKERPVEFIPVSLFGRRAETAAANLVKGKKVKVEGALHFSKRQVGDKKITVGEVRGYRIDWDAERTSAPMPDAA